MSYFNPERALGAPQREGEWCRWSVIIPVMLEKEGKWEGGCMRAYIGKYYMTGSHCQIMRNIAKHGLINENIQQGNTDDTIMVTILLCNKDLLRNI